MQVKPLTICMRRSGGYGYFNVPYSQVGAWEKAGWVVDDDRYDEPTVDVAPEEPEKPKRRYTRKKTDDVTQ